jgi:transposase
MSHCISIDSRTRGVPMPKSYSCDLRKRVIEMVEAGASRHEAADHFAVSVSSVVKWMQRWNESRSAAPKPRGGSVSPLERQAEHVVAVITDQPDLTLEETAAELRRHRIRTSRSALSRFFHRHDFTFKKSLQAAERERADVARARRRWIREQGLLDPARLVFLDETAVTTSMVRLRGRAPRGIRVIGRVPLGAWKTITFIAALRHDKMTAPMAFEGAMTGEMFLAYWSSVCAQHCGAVTSSSSTTAGCTSVPAFARSSKRLERRLGTCRNIPPTSTRLRWLTANSRNSFVAPKREPLWRSGEQFARSCRPSVLKNAPIT